MWCTYCMRAKVLGLKPADPDLAGVSIYTMTILFLDCDSAPNSQEGRGHDGGGPERGIQQPAGQSRSPI